MAEHGNDDADTILRRMERLEAEAAELKARSHMHERCTEAMDALGVERTADLPDLVLEDILGPDWPEWMDRPVFVPEVP